MSEDSEKKPSYWEDEIQFTGKYQSTVLQTLAWAYKPFWKRLTFSLVLGFLGRFLLLANANLLGYWADSFCRAPSPCRTLPEFLEAFSNLQYIESLSVMTFLGFICTLYFRVSFSRVSAQAVSHIYDEVTLRTSRFPMSFFDSTPAGRIITRFSSDYGNVFRLFGGPLAEFIAIIFDLVAMVFLITWAGWIFLPLVIVIAGLNYQVYRLNQSHLRKGRRELAISRAPAISHFAETAQGASTIRTFLKETEFFKRFSNLNDQYLKQKLKTSSSIFTFSYEMNILTAFLLLATGLLAYFLSHTTLVSIGSIGVAFSFVALSGNTVQMFFEWMAQFEEAMVGMERLDNYLRKDLEKGHKLPIQAKFETAHWKHHSPSKSQNIPLFSQSGGTTVTVKDLWFQYKPELPWVLRGISFQLKAGERLGIIGRTGSGKSSLIQALFYLYPLQKGEICVGGRSPQLSPSDTSNPLKIDLQTYRGQIALITQDPILFRGPLRENLTLSDEISDEQCEKVLARVGLQDWLQHLPLGLQYPIEEKGKNLSSGEKQLICMARCLLQNTPLVVMDEATSQIDPQSEEVLNRATEEVFKDRTLIIIAHRLSTLRSCDQVLWLENGEVKRFGKTQEVLKEFLESKVGDSLPFQLPQ